MAPELWLRARETEIPNLQGKKDTVRAGFIPLPDCFLMYEEKGTEWYQGLIQKAAVTKKEFAAKAAAEAAASPEISLPASKTSRKVSVGPASNYTRTRSGHGIPR